MSNKSHNQVVNNGNHINVTVDLTTILCKLIDKVFDYIAISHNDK